MGPDVLSTPRPDATPAGGVPARATVTRTAGSFGPDEVGIKSSYRVAWTRKTLHLDCAGRTAKVDAPLSEAEWHAVRVGTEVPVRIHEQSGEILGIDYEALSTGASRSGPR